MSHTALHRLEEFERDQQTGQPQKSDAMKRLEEFEEKQALPEVPPPVVEPTPTRLSREERERLELVQRGTREASPGVPTAPIQPDPGSLLGQAGVEDVRRVPPGQPGAIARLIEPIQTPIDAFTEQLFESLTFQGASGREGTLKERLLTGPAAEFQERPLAQQIGLGLIDPAAFVARGPTTAARALTPSLPPPNLGRVAPPVEQVVTKVEPNPDSPNFGRLTVNRRRQLLEEQKDIRLQVSGELGARQEARQTLGGIPQDEASLRSLSGLGSREETIRRSLIAGIDPDLRVTNLPTPSRAAGPPNTPPVGRTPTIDVPGQSGWDIALEVANIPRASMVVIDQSSWLRQNLLLATGHPKRYATSVKNSMRAYLSEGATREIDSTMRGSAEFDNFINSGGFYADLDDVVRKEEVLYGQRLLIRILRGEIKAGVPATKISTITGGRPVAALVRASERGFTTATNEMRLGVFTDVVGAWRRATEAGDLSWWKQMFNADPGDEKSLSQLASYLNHSTGRLTVGGFGKFGRLLSAVFFAPQYAISRFALIKDLADPRTVPAVRALIAKDLAASAGTIGGVMAGLSAVPGVVLQSDPRSSDFGKVKMGNTRLDFTAGMGGVIRLAIRLRTGEIKTIDDANRLMGRDWKDEVWNYIKFKFSPPVQFGKNVARPLLHGERPKDFLGRDIEGSAAVVTREILEQWLPLFLQDIIDAYQDQGALAAAAISLPAAVGVGAQTFDVSGQGDTRFQRFNRRPQRPLFDALREGPIGR